MDTVSMRSNGKQRDNVRALVLCGYGLNCDHETAHALHLAGARADRVHINSLIDGSVSLEEYHIMVFVGGFSWGDDHGAGVIQAVRMKTRIGDHLLAFIDAGKLVMGICNGFQTLVNLGLLPGSNGDYRTRSVALLYNDCGNFRDQWVHLRVDPASPCIFTRDLDRMELPVRHGEGKFYAAPSIIEQLVTNGQVALRYAGADGGPADGRFPDNPNGSVGDIAGICDDTGRVFGLMPHPESFNHWTTHPDWTRIQDRARREGRRVGEGPTPGIQMFINAVNYF
jgi:phosphoribosylformylglycinamidine synthase subunit PurQ / glutaminase